jgi:iron complex outermembrane recepter protein
MRSMSLNRFMSATAASALLAFIVVCSPAHAQGTPQSAEDAEAQGDIVVTGSRIPRRDLQGISPVAVTTGEQIKLARAVTIEDFSVKLPQLAGGVNSTSTGSDAYGAQTLDLRNLGQNRTLVLINGTRATPFSFRNAVDVNAIPAPLLKRVDVLTGGAAAVYGADAVAGVVNFIIDDEIRGVSASANYRAAAGGASQYGGYVTFGTSLGDRGSLVGYAEYTQRNALTQGHRAFALTRTVAVAGSGGNFTDVASGRTFSIDSGGAFTLTPQTTDYSRDFLIVQPLKRINASLFFKYDLSDAVQAYGRAMYSNVRTTGSSRGGSQPLVLNEVVGINDTNPFLTPAIRGQLTFVGGVAQVRVNRSIGEAGIVTAKTERDTYQGQIGLRGALTANSRWDAYVQIGQVKERTDLQVARNTVTLASLANVANLFGPGDARLAGLSSPLLQNQRKREQLNAGITLSGDSGAVLNLPGGPIGFALGYEFRDDRGNNNETGTTFFNGKQRSHEGYAELLMPLLKDVPLIKRLEVEAAYRISDYTRSGSNGSGRIGSFGTSKLGATWALSDDIRFRGSRQTVIRAPNIGETEGAIASIPFSALRTVARLNPRYLGDPCALGTGNAAQCTAQGYLGAYDSLNPANLVGGYFFGGNPNIKPERGLTYTGGAVLTPTFLPGFSATIDYYDIKLNDAVGQIQPVDALNSCYITNPVVGNPLCAAVTRSRTTGYILDGFPVDRNLASIKQRGLDIGVTYSHDVPEGLPGKRITLQYQANIVTGYTIQRNAILAPVDCRARYGFACSSDAVSLVAADYKHRVSFNWAFAQVTTEIGWQRIGGVKDSALGSTGSIPAQDYIDLNVSIRPVPWATLNIGIDNVFDKKPPLPTNAGAFNTYPDTYNVVGRTFGASVTIRR